MPYSIKKTNAYDAKVKNKFFYIISELRARRTIPTNDKNCKKSTFRHYLHGICVHQNTSSFNREIIVYSEFY